MFSGDAELNASMQKAIADMVREQNFAIENLTREQVCEVLRQAFACGDITRLVVVNGPHRQQVIYVPFQREQELEMRIAELEAQVLALGG